MKDKKLLLIILNVLLTVGTVTGIAHAKKDSGVVVPPAATAFPSEFSVEVSADGEEYIPVSNKNATYTFSVQAVVNGNTEGKEIKYQWSKRRGKKKDWTEWEEITGAIESKFTDSIIEIGKIQYRCDVTIGEIHLTSEPVTKAGYQNKVTIPVGDYVPLKKIVGDNDIDKKGIKFSVENSNYSKACLKVESNKAWVKMHCTSGKLTVNLMQNGGKVGSIKITSKLLSKKELQKKVAVKLKNKNKKLIVHYNNILGIYRIWFKPAGYKADIIKLKGDREWGKLSYTDKNKFKNKNCKVKMEYKTYPGKKSKKTKWTVIKAK